MGRDTMSEKDKVLKGLACVAQKEAPTANPCAGCGYADRANFAFCVRDIAADALALLEEQDPIAPVKVNRYMETDENGNWLISETYDCGSCGVELHGKANYCHLCGTAVKWNE